MGTPIDFGKDFLHTLYRERDAEKAMGFLADDVVWITPDEILHLKTRKEIRDFLAASIGEDPQPYNVDIASIKSAVVPGSTNTIAYEVNLIPRREQDAKHIRAALTIHRIGKNKGFEIVYIGISRPYQRSESGQLRDFMENLPSGVMVLAGFGGNEFRELYANSYFPVRLGYDADEFYDRSDNNPFFMIPDKGQRRMITLVNEMSALKRPKPISAQINLVTAGGEEVPFQVTTRAAYKDKDGSRTVLYLLFSDLSALLLEQQREQKRLAARAEREKRLDPADQKKLSAETVRLHAEAEEMQGRAAAQLDRIDQLMNAAKEACDHAEQDARARADAEIARAAKAAEERIGAVRAAAEEEKEKALATAAEELETTKKELEQLQEEKRAAEQAGAEQTQNLQKELDAAREQARLRMNQLLDRHKEELEQTKEALNRQLEEARETARNEKDEYSRKVEELQADAEGSRQGFLTQIRRYQERLAQSEQGLRKQDQDAVIEQKERDKSRQRLSSLLEGQMNAIVSLATACSKEQDAGRRKAIEDKITGLAGDIPDMAADLYAIAGIRPGDRNGQESEFTLSSCLNTVIRVIRPQCRRKGIVFSAETQGQVPDQVRGSKSGLQLAFLCVLENAVNNTAQGGRITLTAQADRAVRGSAYFHFTISDTGTGIPDDKLPVLFDNPSGELSIARRTLAGMGGSIQVRSSYGSGSRFEISVNLDLVQPK